MDTDGRRSAVRGLTHLRSVLSQVLDRVDPGATGLEYRLVGTAAALAQGVELPAGDVDILVAHRADVDRFAEALHDLPCLDAPAWLADSRQYFARFQVGGTEVEVSTVEWPTHADTFECIGRGPWQHHVRVRLGTHLVTAVALELRLVSELVRDRPDRYAPLIEHMRAHGADLRLVQRAMDDRGVSTMMAEPVLAQLRPR